MGMDRELETELQQIRQEREQAQRLQRQLTLVKEELARCREKCRGLEAVLAGEQQDADRLKNLSLTALLATLLGPKEERLDKERQELAAARLKYEAGRRELADLEQEVAAMEKKLEPLVDVEERYRRASRLRRSFFRAAGTPQPGPFWNWPKKKAGWPIEIRSCGRPVRQPSRPWRP